MKSSSSKIWLMWCLCLGCCLTVVAYAKAPKLLKQIQWLGQSSLLIKTEKQVIYFDPWEVKNGPPADIIIITHSHKDHLSEADLAALKKPTTIIVTNKETASHIPAGYKIQQVNVGQKANVNGLEIEAVPAYTITRDYHPRDKGWCGYILTLDGVRVYHAGDTDFIPEMKQLKVDIAFLPIGGKYTMEAKEAAAAATALKAQVTIPFHYGKVVGSAKDAETFKKEYKGTVEILPLTNL